MRSARSLSSLWRRSHTGEEISWLSLTPEPERELPPALASLRAGDPRELEELLERERTEVEEIVLRGREGDWLAYLSEAVRLLLDSPEVGLSDSQRAAALEVLANHHRLLLGLPGDAAERTEAERETLERAIAGAESNHTHPNGGA